MRNLTHRHDQEINLDAEKPASNFRNAHDLIAHRHDWAFGHSGTEPTGSPKRRHQRAESVGILALRRNQTVDSAKRSFQIYWPTLRACL